MRWWLRQRGNSELQTCSEWSGVLRRRDVSRRRFVALNDRFVGKPMP
jgi:hypothetical protein